MRKHLSVLALAARGTVWRVLTVTLLAAVLSGALLWLIPAQEPDAVIVAPDGTETPQYELVDFCKLPGKTGAANACAAGFAALLAVNPNTVQKAFKQLEDEGLVTSRAGAKSCIQVTPEQIAALRRELLETEMQAMVDAAKRLGLTREDAHRLLDTLYDKEGTDA